MSWTDDARPRFDIEVELIGEDSNAYNLIGKTRIAIRRHLRARGETPADIEETLKLITKYLTTSESYEELLHRIDQMVTIV